MMSDDITLAEICQRTRWRMKINQYKMAELVYTNQTEISFIERGFIPKDTCKIERIMELARNVGIIK